MFFLNVSPMNVRPCRLFAIKLLEQLSPYFFPKHKDSLSRRGCFLRVKVVAKLQIYNQVMNVLDWFKRIKATTVCLAKVTEQSANLIDSNARLDEGLGKVILRRFWNVRVLRCKLNGLDELRPHCSQLLEVSRATLHTEAKPSCDDSNCQRHQVFECPEDDSIRCTIANANSDSDHDQHDEEYHRSDEPEGNCLFCHGQLAVSDLKQCVERFPPNWRNDYVAYFFKNKSLLMTNRSSSCMR